MNGRGKRRERSIGEKDCEEAIKELEGAGRDGLPALFFFYYILIIVIKG